MPVFQEGLEQLPGYPQFSLGRLIRVGVCPQRYRLTGIARFLPGFPESLYGVRLVINLCLEIEASSRSYIGCMGSMIGY